MRYQSNLDLVGKFISEETVSVPKKDPKSYAPVNPADEITECSFRLRWYRERLPYARKAYQFEEVRRILAWIPILESRMTAARVALNDHSRLACETA